MYKLSCPHLLKKILEGYCVLLFFWSYTAGQTTHIPNYDPYIMQHFNGSIDVEYSILVNHSAPVLAQFWLRKEDIDFVNSELRFTLIADELYNISPKCPVSVNFKTGRNTAAFERPVWVNQSSNSSISQTTYYIWSQTVCIPTAQEIPNILGIFMTATTCSLQDIGFSIQLKYNNKTSAQLRLREERRVVVAPTTPHFLRYTWNNDGSNEHIVIIRLNATADTADICMTVSIQPPDCPIKDDADTVKNSGYYNRFLSNIPITVERRHFPAGFFLVMVTEFNDDPCLMLMPNEVRNYPNGNNVIFEDREKNLTIWIDSTYSVKSHWIAILVPVVIYVVVIFGTYLLQCTPSWMTCNCCVDSWCQEGMSLSWMKTIVCMVPIRFFQTVFGFGKSQKKMGSHLTRQEGKDEIKQKERRYFWGIVFISIFYIIPVVQLVAKNLTEEDKTGNQDICYYNGLCSHPWGPLKDFNHVYSNIGYLLLGMAIMVFASLRKNGNNETLQENRHQSESEEILLGIAELDNGDNDAPIGSDVPVVVDNAAPTGSDVPVIIDNAAPTGSEVPVIVDNAAPTGSEVPTTEKGTIYLVGTMEALGVCMFAEGMLSGIYHICPNSETFQFDTSLMYVMAVLALIKIFQPRHRVHLNENAVFSLLALIIIMAVIGLLWFTSTIIGILGTIFHVVGLLIIQMYIIFASDLLDEDEVAPVPDEALCDRFFNFVTKVVQILLEMIWLSRCFPRKLFGPNHPNVSFFRWSTTFNIGLMIMSWTVTSEQNFASKMLFVFIANLVISESYYIIMKFVHGEFHLDWLSLKPFLYMTLSLMCWGPGLYFFTHSLSPWELPPAQARFHNAECVVLNFYDNHDLWHMLSAPALFFSFMFLQTIDDGLINHLQEDIPVF